MEGKSVIRKASMRTQVISNKLLFEKIREQIREGRRVTIRAKGWSMLPLIWDDRDTLTLGPLSEDTFKCGRIVLAQLGTGRYVVHRICQIKGERYCLRGDGNPYQEEYVHHDRVYAELVSIKRNGKVLDRGSCFWRLCTWLWPKHGFVRRALLFMYRRVFVRPATRQPRRLTN